DADPAPRARRSGPRARPRLRGRAPRRVARQARRSHRWRARRGQGAARGQARRRVHHRRQSPRLRARRPRHTRDPSDRHVRSLNMTVLDDAPPEIARFRELLLGMSYDDPEVRPLLDLEGLKQWLPGRTEGYALLARAVERFSPLPAWLGG